MCGGGVDFKSELRRNG